jgi:hypothetical protein
MTLVRMLVAILLLAGTLCGWLFHRPKHEPLCPKGQVAQLVGIGKDPQGITTAVYMCGRP